MSDQEPQVQDQEEEPVAEVEAGDVDENGDPWDGYDVHDEIRTKYAHPGEALKALHSTQAELTRKAQKIAEWEEWYEQQETGAEEPAAYPQAAVEGFDLEAIIRNTKGLVQDDGEINPSALAAVLHVNNQATLGIVGQAIQAELDRRFGEYDKTRVAPLATKHQEDALAEQLDELRDVYGDDFDAVAGEVQAMVATDPDLLQRMDARAAFGQAAHRRAQKAAEKRRLEAQGYSINRSGRATPPKRVSVEEQEREAFERLASSRERLI